MKKLNAALALALAAAPAGAAQYGVSSVPQSAGLGVAPVATTGLKYSALTGPAALPTVAGLLPASALTAPVKPLGLTPLAGIATKTIPFATMSAQKGVPAKTSLSTLQGINALEFQKPSAISYDAHRLSVPFDGANKSLSPVAGFSSAGGSANGAGGSGSGQSGSALSALIARIEALGQVQEDPNTGVAYKLIQPKVEQTPNGQSMAVVALTGTVDANGVFTKTGIVAVSQSAERTATPISATKKRLQDKQTAVQITAGLDGKADQIRSMSQDHTDIVETTKHDPKAKQADFSKEAAAAQALVGASDFQGLIDEVQNKGQFDIQSALQGAPRVVLPLDQTQDADGTQRQFVAVLELDAQGQPSRLVLVRASVKSTPNASGTGDTAREEQTVYISDLSGTLSEAVSTGKDHSLDVQENAGQADAAGQAEFDAIVAKVAQP